jgi:hypothetical protein
MRLVAKNSSDSKEAPSTVESKMADAKADSKSSVARPKAKMPRPAWALTEDETAAVAEDKELEDEDDLISFANGLDFDRFIDDLEVQTMMEKVKQRIAQLEHESVVEKQRDDEIEERAALRMAMGQRPEEDDSADEKDGPATDEAYLAAKEILSEAGDLRGVHSTKSVASMSVPLPCSLLTCSSPSLPIQIPPGEGLQLQGGGGCTQPTAYREARAVRWGETREQKEPQQPSLHPQEPSRVRPLGSFVHRDRPTNNICLYHRDTESHVG